MILFAALTLHGLHRVGQQRALDPMDTTAYLQEAHFIAEHGGPLNLIRLLVSGTYDYDNRQPLYPWVLSWMAVRDMAFLPRAKLASLAAGLACCALTLWLVRRWAGDLAALLVGLLLLFDFTFFRLASMVACEALLMVFVVGWWGAAATAFDRPRWWPVAGALAGAAFMTKASGLFLVGIVVLTVLVRRRWRLLHSGWFYLFFVGFVAVTSPLLVRNARLFHNPVYNINAATMWLDDWSQTYEPAFRTHPPGPLDYLRTHTAGEVARRALEGVAGQAAMTAEALHVLNLPAFPDPAAPHRPFVGAPYWLSGIVVLGLAGYGLAGDWRRGGRALKGATAGHRHTTARAAPGGRDRAALTIVAVATFFVVFSWYHPVVQSPRFILPLVPLVFFYAALGAIRVWRRFAAPARDHRPLAIALVALLCLTALYLGVLHLRDPLTSYDIPPGYDALRDWLRSNVGRDEPFVLGPTHIYPFQAYSPDFPRRQVPLPKVESLAALNAHLRQQGIRVVVLDIEAYSRNRALFRGLVDLDGETATLHLAAPIPGWQLVAHRWDAPAHFLVFRLDQPPPSPAGAEG